jgi:hypothetical protein
MAPPIAAPANDRMGFVQRVPAPALLRFIPGSLSRAGIGTQLCPLFRAHAEDDAYCSLPGLKSHQAAADIAPTLRGASPATALGRAEARTVRDNSGYVAR